MKKIAAALSFLTLTACGIHAGDINAFPERNSMFEIWQTKDIFFYDEPQDQEVLTSSKTITEEDIKRGEILIAQNGQLMAFSRTFRTDFFDLEVLRVNKNGILSSSSTPYYIDKDAAYTGFGETTIDGQKYMLVRKGKTDKDVLLINGDGEVYNRIGRIIKGRLAILDTDFYLEPEDIQFSPVVSTRSEQSDYLSGYELRYAGIFDGQMKFNYTILGEECFDQEYLFPLTEQTIEIEGLKINVLEADSQHIEYTIL